MIRQEARPHGAWEEGIARAEPQAGPLRQSGARHGAAAIARLLAAPFAAVAAALAGMLFVVLLPICGIATIAEGIARASWRFVRRSVAAAFLRGA